MSKHQKEYAAMIKTNAEIRPVTADKRREVFLSRINPIDYFKAVEASLPYRAPTLTILLDGKRDKQKPN